MPSYFNDTDINLICIIITTLLYMILSSYSLSNQFVCVSTIQNTKVLKAFIIGTMIIICFIGAILIFNDLENKCNLNKKYMLFILVLSTAFCVIGPIIGESTEYFMCIYGNFVAMGILNVALHKLIIDKTVNQFCNSRVLIFTCFNWSKCKRFSYYHVIIYPVYFIFILIPIIILNKSSFCIENYNDNEQITSFGPNGIDSNSVCNDSATTETQHYYEYVCLISYIISCCFAVAPLISPLCVQIMLLNIIVSIGSSMQKLTGIWVEIYLMIFIAPIMIILLFVTIKTLRKFILNIISMYLIIFDLSTDFLLTYYFFRDGNYFWSLIKLFTFIIAQLFAVFVSSNDDNVKWYHNLFTLFGLGRPYYIIKSWINDKYVIEYQRIKLWEIMYTSLPSVMLKIFILLTSNIYFIPILQSIIVTLLSVSWEMLSFFIKITSKSNTDIILQKQSSSLNEKFLTINDNNKDIQTKNGSFLSKFDHVRSNKELFISLYLYMFSDFYIRSFPFIYIMIYIHIKSSVITEILFFIICLVIFGVIEYFLNKYMRISNGLNKKYLLAAFSISIYSSFYNICCCLSLLKNNEWFGKSVSLIRFKKEYYFRLILSLILIIISSILLINGNINMEINGIIFVILYFVLLILNLSSIHVIKKYTNNNDENSDEIDD